MNAPYTQGDGKWHSEYMAKVKTMSTDSLRYVIKDCRDAIAAINTHLYKKDWDFADEISLGVLNPKCEQYMDEIHYCATELRIRNEAAAPHDNQPTTEQTNQPTNEPTNRPTNKPKKQPTNQPQVADLSFQYS